MQEIVFRIVGGWLLAAVVLTCLWIAAHGGLRDDR